MRRFILWIAAISITFAIGVGADRLWWYFLAAPPPTPEAAPLAVDIQPQREIVYVPAPALPPPPPPLPNLILDYDSEEFSMGASFYIMGSKPKEFADFDSIEALLTPPHTDGDNASIRVYTRRGDQFDSARVRFGLVTERQFFFATDSLREAAFEYRFDGEFLRTDFDAVAGKNKAVLRGTLTKMKNGRAVAQHEFTFRMEYLGC